MNLAQQEAENVVVVQHTAEASEREENSLHKNQDTLKTDTISAAYSCGAY